MIKAQDQFLLDVYRFDNIQKSFVLDVSAESYEHLFNHLDPSPYKQRDLDPDLLDYLLICSEDIPFYYPIQISVKIPLSQQDNLREKEIMAGMKSNFAHWVHLTKSRISRIRKKAFTYILTSISLITISTLIRNWMPESVGLVFIPEGLMIGGWVFMWEAISLLFIHMNEEKDPLKHYQRLLNSKIGFIYL
jgi:hypothetical protein